MERVKVTKENFFSRFKPATELILESGEPLISEPVIEIIRKGKEFMERGDVDGFYYLMGKSPERQNLNDDEIRCLLRTQIIEGGTTVFEVLSDIDDLLDDDYDDLMNTPIDE